MFGSPGCGSSWDESVWVPPTWPRRWPPAAARSSRRWPSWRRPPYLATAWERGVTTQFGMKNTPKKWDGNVWFEKKETCISNTVWYFLRLDLSYDPKNNNYIFHLHSHTRSHSKKPHPKSSPKSLDHSSEPCKTSGLARMLKRPLGWL